jgi:hypothetical protein
MIYRGSGSVFRKVSVPVPVPDPDNLKDFIIIFFIQNLVLLMSEAAGTVRHSGYGSTKAKN